ncbi:MAG: biotin-dependent carboxyltransferase family protein [Phycisphaerales bacterium JB050]
MNSVRIEHPGLVSSVQDLGRRGHSAMGVGPAGAADALSLRIGNRLVGNEEHRAAIEMTLTGARVRFGRDALVCLVGADAPEARIEHGGVSRVLEGWTPTPVGAGAVMSVGAIGGGCRVLLCVDGGVATEPVLGSRSAHLASGVGGCALKAGDELALGGARVGLQTGRPSGEVLSRVREHLARRTLRIVEGAQHGWFSEGARRAIVEREFVVSDRSDRTGVRLEGEAIEVPERSMQSEGVVTGAIQLAHGGLPIVLLVDRPATGGYPVMGCVIGADLPALGQVRPRDRVRFEWIDRERAVELLREQERLIGEVPVARASGYVRSGMS